MHQRPAIVPTDHFPRLGGAVRAPSHGELDAGRIEEVDFPEMEEVADGIAEALPVEKA